MSSDRLVPATRCTAVVCAATVAIAFWAQADTSGFERQSTAQLVGGAVLVTCVVTSPFIAALFLSALLRGLRWAQMLFVAAVVGAAAWTVWLARQPIPPQGRDGIIFFAAPVFQCMVLAALCALCLAAASAQNRPSASATNTIQPPPPQQVSP